MAALPFPIPAMKPALLTVSLACLLWPACHRAGDSAKPAPPPPVRGSIVTLAPVELPVEEQVVGTVQPKLQATISAKVTGRLTEMRAVPGISVEKDAVLAEIEAPQLRAALDQAEASLANAQAEAERFRALRDSGSVAQRDIDRVETALRVATAEHERIRSTLADATVKAPFAGRVTRKHADTGDLVQPGTPICRLEDPTMLRLEIDVAESLAQGLAPGRQFPVRIDSAGLDLTGTVAEVSPAADMASRTFLVKLDLPPGAGVLAGQFGRARVARGTRRVLVVPPGALVRRGQLECVAVVDDGNLARLRIVRTGEATAAGIEILAGLREGERIVNPLPEDFADGSPVEAQQP